MFVLNKSLRKKTWHTRFPVPSILILLVFLSSHVITPVLANGDGSLDILLTNDDGWNSVGIQTMKDALVAAGHNVTLVAPASDSSGGSAAVTLALVAATEEYTNEYSVDASPATCVFLGLTAILNETPDLVVSGTNSGANLGLFTPVSGTVGAATAAILSGVPSIAFSTDVPQGVDPELHFQNVADFAVRLIGHLQSKPGSLASEEGLLPVGLGLKVDYPPLAPSEIEGVTVSVQGKSAPGSLIYIKIDPGPPALFVPSFGPPPDVEEVKDADMTDFYAGFITIVPIDGDYTAKPGERNSLKSVINGISP